MLHNIVPSELNHLAESKFDFFLTGSRFFKTGHYEQSDWDFYVQDSTEVYDYLTDHGYRSNFKYDDRFTPCVMTKEEAGIKIDVQLVVNAARKPKAQKLLIRSIHAIPKEFHKVLWDLAFEWLKSN